LIGVDDAVRRCDGLRRIAEERIVHAERLREGPVGLRRIDADGKVGDVELANLVPTLTE
jgi:hypothetical protein